MKGPAAPDPREERIARAAERVRVASDRASQAHEHLIVARERLAQARRALGAQPQEATHPVVDTDAMGTETSQCPLHAGNPGGNCIGARKGEFMTGDGRQPHALLIDDTQEILDLMAELLEDEGYRVTTSQALLDINKVKALAPDVIVQDLLFEGMQEQGWKFLELVRLDPELARIPLVLCTAAVRTVNDPEMAAQLDRLGIRVVLKPFTIEDLLTALSETLTAQALIHTLNEATSEGDERGAGARGPTEA
jgi:CheY-like chemotaxis protein